LGKQQNLISLEPDGFLLLKCLNKKRAGERGGLLRKLGHEQNFAE
jgi:hypothetical protein